MLRSRFVSGGTLAAALPPILALTTLAMPALAGPVTEQEADGSSVNNRIITAQGVTFSDFTKNTNTNVFGNLPTATVRGRNGGFDVDFFSFHTGVGIGYFDIDNDTTNFNSRLSLFDGTGTLIAATDDSFPADPGSASGRDAFLGTYQFTKAGTYYLAVSEVSNYPNALNTPGSTFTSMTRPDGFLSGGIAFNGSRPGDSSFLSFGPQAGSPYTLNISLSNPAVPEPSEYAVMGMIGFTLCGLMVRARRKNRISSSTNAIVTA